MAAKINFCHTDTSHSHRPSQTKSSLDNSCKMGITVVIGMALITMLVITPPTTWSIGRGGVLRTMVREDVLPICDPSHATKHINNTIEIVGLCNQGDQGWVHGVDDSLICTN